MDTPLVSLVIPCHNEQGNLRPLVAAIHKALVPLKATYEIIVTDDCSVDNSWAVLKELAAEDSRLCAQRFARNCGQSAAMWAGMRAARGQVIVTLDADLQNDPIDFPRFMEALQHYDCVCGSRVNARQQGDSLLRQVSSRLANWVRNRLTHETISDSACCYRAFKRECIQNLKFFKGMHRFLPTLIKLEGYKVTEINITHNPRVAGRSHYGVWNRVFGSTYDLLAVRWMQKRMFRYEIGERINLPAERPNRNTVASD